MRQNGLTKSSSARSMPSSCSSTLAGVSYYFGYSISWFLNFHSYSVRHLAHYPWRFDRRTELLAVHSFLHICDLAGFNLYRDR